MKLNETLFDQLTSVKSLNAAWRRVRANRGAAGIDAVSWFGFEENLDANLSELAREIASRTYQPLPARFVEIARKGGKNRELGILAIRDRVAQRAVLDLIEPGFEAEMHESNYAFRPGRNVEMAIRRVLLDRAAGNCWMVESDVFNYFGEIDRRILVKMIAPAIDDARVIQLIERWLEAGVVNGTDAESEKVWWEIAGTNIGSAAETIGETISENLDEFVAGKLGLNPYESEFLISNPDLQEDFRSDLGQDYAPPKRGRAALRRIIEGGLLYAVTNRALLTRFLGVKALGVGGLILAGGMLAPKAFRLARKYLDHKTGILQGSPISPLLANIYLTPFDRSMAANGLKMVRYCDDFVISCATRAEAESAMAVAARELSKFKLRVHPEKTRIIGPDDEFAFLGYSFGADGNVRPPPTAPARIVSEIRELAGKAFRARAKTREVGDSPAKDRGRFREAARNRLGWLRRK